MEDISNDKTSEYCLEVDQQKAFLEQYNKEIDEAMARIDKGHFTSQKELEKEMESW